MSVKVMVVCLALSAGLFFAGSPCVAAKSTAQPYLAATAEPDELAVMTPPPPEGSAAAQGEHDLYASTRSLIGTPRGDLATADADRTPDAVWADFNCALGSAVPADRVPAVVGLLGRLDQDIEQATRIAKLHYERVRPLVGNDAPLCVTRTEKLGESYSFPSGHATLGWATALVLAELVPDRATQLLQRGRVFGDSRVICGMHWLSDVQAGRTAADALVAVLHANVEFRHDLEGARAELAAARDPEAPAPDAALCRREADAAASVLH